ncbi:hypothetical protein HAX54_052842 [Datura stramonium]|uniref:Uncharacterized protein n=1 Tax=Datura stramonium TaxID=4076 RepID=A0ABS8WNU8_DATST|nr:hypothetical protein [Datura stramonium]
MPSTSTASVVGSKPIKCAKYFNCTPSLFLYHTTDNHNPVSPLSLSYLLSISFFLEASRMEENTHFFILSIGFQIQVCSSNFIFLLSSMFFLPFQVLFNFHIFVAEFHGYLKLKDRLSF